MQLGEGFESVLLRLLVASIGGWLIAVVAEKFANPLNRTAWRNDRNLLIHLGIYTLIFFVAVGITLRAYFATGIALACIIAVIIVNNAKHKALNEPFVFTDFSLFSQAVKHPRLYLPFLNPLAAIMGSVAIIAVIYLGLVLDKPLTDQIPVNAFISLLFTGSVVGVGLLLIGTHKATPPTFEIIADIDQHGLLPSLWLHRLAEMRSTCASNLTHKPLAYVPPSDVADSRRLPHFIVVQSESFFDARRLMPTVKHDILQNYDRVVTDAKCAGRMHVPAWGANTMRTEFAFLTGISREQLGVHWFNPYRKFARQSLPSLASRFASIGYETLCVHPHPEEFFSRDKVFPALGFNRFLDIDEFRNAEKFGPYISDASVTDKIIEILTAADRPTFIFAITMENHGPLHLEKVPESELSELYSDKPAAAFQDLSVYLRHLKNADRMIGTLTKELATDYPESTLVFYGDHVPSMPAVYKALAFDDGRSDYFIWSPKKEGHQVFDEALRAEELGEQGLLAAGLINPKDRSSRA